MSIRLYSNHVNSCEMLTVKLRLPQRLFGTVIKMVENIGLEPISASLQRMRADPAHSPNYNRFSISNIRGTTFVIHLYFTQEFEADRRGMHLETISATMLILSFTRRSRYSRITASLNLFIAANIQNVTTTSQLISASISPAIRRFYLSQV